jgi:hypothetical protein
MAEGVSSSMMYLIYCKNFCKCHNVPQPAQQEKRKKTGRGDNVSVGLVKSLEFIPEGAEMFYVEL